MGSFAKHFSIVGLIATSMLAMAQPAAAQRWKYGQLPKTQQCLCANVNGRAEKICYSWQGVVGFNPGITGRIPWWPKQGVPQMEGQWQYECSRSQTSNAYYAIALPKPVMEVRIDNWAVIWANCYIPQAIVAPMYLTRPSYRGPTVSGYACR